MKPFFLLAFCAITGCGQSVLAREELPLDVAREDVAGFVSRVHERHGMDRDTVASILGLARIQPRIIEAISRPAEKVKPWHEYRAIFMTPDRIGAGVEFARTHREELEEIAARTGVPLEILVGIVGVETFYGRITGRYRVLDALATLAFEYPPRSGFFSGELEQFLLMLREQGLEAEGPTGSYAGAMGLPQFIPSSYRAYAVDGDGDGRVDLWESTSDVLSSVANYFSAHGWQAGAPVVARARPGDADAGALTDPGLKPSTTVGALRQAGVELTGAVPESPEAPAGLFVLEGPDGPQYWAGFHNFYVITRYNRSLMYALAVHELGQAVRERLGADTSAG